LGVIQDLWIILILYGIVRSLILRFSPYRKQYLQIPITAEETEIYHNQRTHLITLASFVIVGISIIVALPKDDITQAQALAINDSLFFLSIGMASSFIGSYLFSTMPNRWFPFTGETLEYIAIMATGIGLFNLIQFLTIELRVQIVYIIFGVGIGIVTFLDLYYNKKILMPESEEEKEDAD
jgi:hypothetical protein